MKALTVLAVLGLVVGGLIGAKQAAKPIAPQPIYGTILDEAQTDYFLDMAVKYSPYHKPLFKRPKVDIVPTPKWQYLMCGNPTLDCGLLGYTSGEERNIVHVVAVMPAEGVKRLGWTRDEIIVHELVHWLQHEADAEAFDDMSCAMDDAIETEAYNAQFQFAVRELHNNHGFWKPEIYSACVAEKIMNGRGHH